MNRVVGTLVWMLIATFCHAQVHVSKLVIPSKQTFSFDQTDIVVADTLIMEDSSRIELNTLKIENYLHTKVLIVGRHCSIVGNGVNGKPGRSGRPGDSPIGPCRNGINGTTGGRGLDGTHGVNLFLYLDRVTFMGPLTIDLHGGDGGTGGKGGEGGTGSSGTIHCNGGNGGYGGNAGSGANGGDGGSITIHCPINLTDLLHRNLKYKIYGGKFGSGGRGGYPGGLGNGPNGKRGKHGVPGKEGTDGVLGKYGKVSFVHN